MKPFALTMILLLTSHLNALPLGNPWEATLHSDGLLCEGACPFYRDPQSCWKDAWSARWGFYGDFVFDRHMQIHSKESSANLHRAEINTEAAYLVINFWDRCDFFGTLGATNVTLTAPIRTFGNPVSNVYGTLATETDFSWSIGVRSTLWEWRCLGIGAEAQYFATRPHINFTQRDGFPLRYQPNHVIMKYQEWQVGLGAAYRINIFCDQTALIPYAGVKVCRAVIKMDELQIPEDSEIFLNLESDRNWGFAFGVTFLGCNKISVTAEARLNDERAFYINSQLRF